jgi:hypothetical protein
MAFSGAEIIVTDSFHGVCFALIYHKPFIAICNAWRGTTRFNSILEFVGLQDRLVHSFDEFDGRKFTEIDWTEIDVRIASKKAFSKKFLRRAVYFPPRIFVRIKKFYKKCKTRLFNG